MTSNSKFDSSSNSPDSSGYMNGQRGSYGASMDRSGSFREGSESRMSSSAAGSSSRPFSTLSQSDAINLSMSLLPDLKQVAIPRQGDLRKLLTSVTGASQDDSSSSHGFGTKGASPMFSDDYKRAKANLQDGYSKARERAKYYGDLASRYEKFLSSNCTKKRSRPDISSMERQNSLLSGGTTSKNATQIHPGSGSLDPASQRSEERSKAVIPNRRIRSSMVMEQRPSASLKPCNTVSRERDAVKIVSGNANLAEEKPPGIGWDKGKMKKKRTSVKTDISDQSVAIGRTPSGDRDAKHGLQQRLGNDTQPRVGNTLGFRSNVREENPIGNPTAGTNRSNMTARAPRSNGGPPSRASPSVRINGSPEEPDILPYTTKSNSGLAPGNRKRSAPAQSSSPPVTQWVGQRLHKRSARRPLVSGHDDTPFSDVETCLRTNDGVEPPRHISISSCQSKATGEHASTTGLSESEESAIAENKIKEKVKKCADLEEKPGLNLHRAAALPFPPRKNKASGEGEDELGDGARRLPRPVRAFPPLRPGVHSSTEKLENASSANHLRNAKVDADRAECKPGRPTTKKFQERRGYPRPRYETTDLQGEAEDDREELMTAANYALNTKYACPNLFWKRAEPYFGLLSTEDNSFLKKQNDLSYNSLPTLQAKAASDDHEMTANGVGINKCDGTLRPSIERENTNDLSFEDAVQSTGVNSGISICQLLLSAMIEEVEESNPYYCKGGEEECYSNDTCSMEFGTKANEMDHLPLENAQRVRAYSNGYIANARLRYYDEPNHHNMENYNMGLEYKQMRVEDRIRLELNEIGLSPEPMPDLAQGEDEDLNDAIRRLEEQLHEKARSNRSMLSKLEKKVTEAAKSQERELERIALDKLVGIAYAKYMALRGSSSSGSKSTNKITKHRVISFVKRTLARCQTFERTGKSCFSESPFREMFQNITKSSVDTEGADIPSGHPSLPSQAGLKSNKHEKYSETVAANAPENSSGKDELWSNKVKKRELLLNVGNLVSGTKGKRSERDGKRNNRDGAARNGTSRVGRPALSNNTKGERKNKSKPKHKMAQASLSDLLGGDSLPSTSKPRESVPDESIKPKDSGPPPVVPTTSGAQDATNDEPPIDLSQLQLPGIEELGVSDDFGSQSQDLGAWFNFDDDGLQDQDLVGLEIPMDDLSDLNMVL